MNLSLPKNSLLTKPQNYKEVYSAGRRLRGKGFSLIFSKNKGIHDRLGISVSGKKLAVERNRIKRLLKEFYRHNRSFPSKAAGNETSGQGVDLIIATYKSFSPHGLRDIEKILAPYNQ